MVSSKDLAGAWTTLYASQLQVRVSSMVAELPLPEPGACGSISYSFVGAYKQIHSLIPKDTSELDITRALGQNECARSTAEERASIVNRFKKVN